MRWHKGPETGVESVLTDSAWAYLELFILVQRLAQRVRLRSPQCAAHVHVDAQMVFIKVLRHRAADVQDVLQVRSESRMIGRGARDAHGSLEAEGWRLEPMTPID